MTAVNLTKGYTQSCGCLSSEIHRAAASTMIGVRADDYVDGTDIKQLLQAPRAANTSGTVGVSYDKSVRTWKACITFKHRRYYLGSSRNKDVAIALRKEAEERIHGDFLQGYRSQMAPDRDVDP